MMNAAHQLTFRWMLGGLLSCHPVLAQVPKEIRATLETYCFDCHDDSIRKAKLSLEQMIAKPDDRTAMAAWTRVYDKLVEGEMPPKDEPKPAPAEQQQLTAWLRDGLHDFSLEKQQSEGRATIRRMNRNEYENTLRDLLGISVGLKDLLPEDATVAGFDNVGSGLGISASHLVNYQLAADKALSAALAKPLRGGVERVTGRSYPERWWRNERPDEQSKTQLHLHYSARVEGDSYVIYQQTESNGFLEMEFGEPSRPGIYRLRAKVSARNTGGKPLPVLFFRVGVPREFNVNNARVIAVRDAPADVPTVIEEEIVVTDEPNLGAGKRIAIKAWTLPMQKHPDELAKDIAAGKPQDFSGPGLAVEWVEMEGPLPDDRGYRQLFGDVPRGERGEPLSNNPADDAARLIPAFLSAAFRRPVDQATAAPFVAFAVDRIGRGYSFADAMMAAYRNVLCSPNFLMLVEKPGPLDDFAIVSRLSYFLWSSRPDELLLARAADGSLRRPEVLHAEVERMLGDSKAKRFNENFTGQWLDLRKLHMTKPDTRYIEFDDALLWAMPRETTAFFEEVLKQDLSVDQFVWSDWTFLNQRLARHYGVAGVDSWEMRKTALPPGSRRGGVMTQAAVLKVTANGTTTSPVLRGKWVLERILGRPPAPPPPDIPALEPDIRGATTVRQQLDKHRHIAACASCHVKIDPPGFALETYDVIGGWRDWYRAAEDGTGGKERVSLTNYPGREVWRGPDVEQGFITSDGRPFKDADEYRRILLEDREQIARNITQKLLVYATGADIQFADREVVDSILRETRSKSHGLRSLLHAVVQSRCFLNK